MQAEEEHDSFPTWELAFRLSALGNNCLPKDSRKALGSNCSCCPQHTSVYPACGQAKTLVPREGSEESQRLLGSAISAHKRTSPQKQKAYKRPTAKQRGAGRELFLGNSLMYLRGLQGARAQEERGLQG